MKRLALTFALACAALALASPAQAGLTVGVADDHPLGQPDQGAAFFMLMNDVGLSQVRLTVNWDATQPTTIMHQDEIESVLPVATLRGVRVIFSIRPLQARSIAETPAASDEFVAFLEHVARTLPTVKDVIVGNEPNLSRFWQPQFSATGNGASGAAFEALLARSYDRLKAVDPTINVIGVGLSPRGGDNARASSNISTSPVKFLQGMGAAYRASGRTKPIMDQFAYHPYPKKDTDSLTKGYIWPNAGVTNLDRIKQAFWDAFSDTGQKTFEQGLRVKLDEVGWQVAVSPRRCRRTSAPRASCRRPRPPRPRSTPRCSGTSPATRQSKPCSSSGSRTSRTSTAGRPGSCALTAPFGLRTPRCGRSSQRAAGTAPARSACGATRRRSTARRPRSRRSAGFLAR